MSLCVAGLVDSSRSCSAASLANLRTWARPPVQRQDPLTDRGATSATINLGTTYAL
jgi:hypothetical protein